MRRNVHQRHPLRDEHFDLGGLRRYGAQPHSSSHGGGWPAFEHRPYVCGDGLGVPWAICWRAVKVRGNPLASSFIASCLNTRPKASSSSASFRPTPPLANRKQRSAWTCRCFSCQVVDFGLLPVLCSEREGRSSSPVIRFAERAEGVKGLSSTPMAGEELTGSGP